MITLVVVYIAGVFVLRSEKVQNIVRPWLEDILTKALETKVEVGHISLNFPMEAHLENLTIYDPAERAMIQAKEINSSVFSIPILQLIFNPSKDKLLTFSSIELVEPVLNLHTDPETGKLNILHFAELGGEKKEEPGGMAFNFNRVVLRNGTLTLVDHTKPASALKAQKGSLNFGYLDASKINGDVKFTIGSEGQLYTKIRDLSFVENHSGFKLDKLVTEMRQFQTDDPHLGTVLEFGDTEFQSEKTHLTLSGSFTDDYHISDTIQKPRFDAKIHPSTIDFTTIDYFLPSQLPLEGVVDLHGPVYGFLDTLRSDSLFLAYAQETRVNMAMEMRNLTDSAGPDFEFNFRPGIVQFEELNTLLKTAEVPLYGKVALNGKIEGNLRKLRSQAMVIGLQNNTRINASIRIDNFIEPEEMIMDVKFAQSTAQLSEVRNLLKNYELPPWLDNLGRTKMDGRFIGGIHDFVVDGTFNSAIGKAITNLHIVTNEPQPLAYNGWVELENFNLDRLGMAEAEISQSINFKGRVDGKGTDLASLNTKLSGKIKESKLMGYPIASLGTDKIIIRNDSIFGEIVLDDPHGNASLDLILEFSDSTADHFNFYGDIGQVDLQHYDVTDQKMLVSSVVNVRIDGDSIENYTGRAKFFSLLLEKPEQGDSLSLHDLRIYSRENSMTSKNLEVKSSMLSLNFESNLSFKRGEDLVRKIIKEGALYLSNNDSLRKDYYSNLGPREGKDEIDFSVSTKKELNEAMAFFDLPLHIGSNTTIDGRFESESMHQVDMNIQFDTLAYDGMGLPGDSATFSLTKSATSNSLVAVGNLDISKLYVSEGLVFENVRYEAQFSEKEIEHFLLASQDLLENKYHLHAITSFKTDSIISQLIAGDSKIRIKEQDWSVRSTNRIINFKDEIIVEKLEFTNGNQSILINGTLSKKPEDVLAVLVRRLDLDIINEIWNLPSPIAGKVQLASLKVAEGLGEPNIDFAGQINGLSYEAIDSVTVAFNGEWKASEGPSLLGLSTTITYQDLIALKVNGYYDFENDFINFTAENSTLPLPWLQPFTNGVLSDIKGNATLKNLAIKGKVKEPRLKGQVSFSDTRFKVDYLNNTFLIEDRSFLDFNNQMISLNNLTVTDTMMHPARLMGGVYFQSLDDIRLNIKIPRLDNFLFMNTQAAPDALFYGKIAVTSLDTTYVKGPVDKIDIEASVRTASDSWLDLPISGYSSTTRLDYVTFYSNGEQVEPNQEKVDLSGFTLDLKVEPTPDARIRLIFDEQVGDIIEAQGEGALNLKISEKGEFTMSGYYQVNEGNYMFTAQNLVNKKFIIQPGGRIVWTGDPLAADIDIAAIYRVKADIGDILGNSSGSGGKVPVEIVMNMKGSLLKPTIDLQLRLDQLNSDDVAGLASYFRNIQYDEQELNRQVVSLLVFRRFAPKSSYVSSTSNASGVTSSLSELVSNQLNYWLSQTFDSNLGVELNTNNFDEVELALSASFFDDKVTVERNGTIVGNRTGQVSIGDISVLIKLLPRTRSDEDDEEEGGKGNSRPVQGQGQLVLEIFNRENFTLSNTNSYTTGAGIFYKKDFDHLIDLFRSFENRRQKEAIDTRFDD